MKVYEAGIAPYPYTKYVCRMIAVKDYLSLRIAFKSMRLMKMPMPPERFHQEVVRFWNA